MSAFKGTPVAESAALQPLHRKGCNYNPYECDCFDCPEVSTRNADCPGCGRAVPAYVCKDCNGEAVNQHNETCTGCDGWGETWDYCPRCLAALREAGAI